MSAPRELVFLDDEYYVHATSSRVDDRKRVLKQGDTFGVFDRFGDVHPFGQGEHGIYHQDTRFLSRWELLIDGQRPLLLNSIVTHGTSIFAVDLTNVDLYDGDRVVAPRGEIHIFRGKLLWGRECYEQIRITNFAHQQIRMPLTVVFGADYSDIFEVRGLARDRKGTLQPPSVEERGVVLSYQGLDGVLRSTRLTSTIRPDRIEGDQMSFSLTLEAGAEVSIGFTISCEAEEPQPRRVSLSFEQVERKNREAAEQLARHECRIHTANEQFNDWLNRSFADLRILSTKTDEGVYPYAGVPWYSTIFGRDGLITALQTLWINPQIARGVLDVLASRQATETVPEQDAEPGKIVHEVRRGEMAALKEVPFGQYYGTVDATPLFLMLAARYFDQTGDLDYARQLWPNVERALAWIDLHGDKNEDGFIDYLRQAARGLANQGWKDSWDSVSHEDGSFATGAIALCEVQGYVYAGKRGAARLARALRKPDLAEKLEKQAATLRQRFNERFWCDDLGTYAIALDGERRPCRVRSSNAGHVLFAGLATPERARRTAKTLMAEDSFSGWGIRTLSRLEKRFNPMSYHNGSIWPHDTAIIAAGFARYGFRRQAVALMQGLFDATLFLDEHRLPELFCGFRRRGGQGPTLYPVACLPQAWASGAVFMLLQACLGISFRQDKPQIRFTQPMLPEFLPWVRLENLRVGDGTVDLLLHRHPRDVSINVLRSEGDVGVAVHLEP
ncbi:MAG: amylo-alpha-1,6-glucosidase [Gammaproteobacteria bacterium]|nr:amylo-alpha-1,6-glucosidase [Gammaproteobacteria bacterium]